jgi:hypothetical protein
MPSSVLNVRYFPLRERLQVGRESLAKWLIFVKESGQLVRIPNVMAFDEQFLGEGVNYPGCSISSTTCHR